MNNTITSRGLRATLLAFSGALLFGLAACDNQYRPPVEGQSMNWGQQHYLDNQQYQAQHLDSRSDASGGGARAE